MASHALMCSYINFYTEYPSVWNDRNPIKLSMQLLFPAVALWYEKIIEDAFLR